MRELYGRFGVAASRREADTWSDVADTQARQDFPMAAEFVDSVHLALEPGEDADERIVRPSLAILFRMAVGPDADYYGPRFLEYERTGRSFPSWNWAAFMAPGVWAIYRRLWGAGIAFTVWPLLALVVCWLALPSFSDTGLMGVAAAALAAWFSPGVVGALTANTLLHRKSRVLVQQAETHMSETDKAARWLARRTVIAPVQAVAASVIMLAALGVVVPVFESAYSDQLVKARIAESIAAMRPLQRQLEEWFMSRSPDDAPAIALDETLDTPQLDKVNVSLVNGRVRLALDRRSPSSPAARSCSRPPSTDGCRCGGSAYRSTSRSGTCRRSASRARAASACDGRRPAVERPVEDCDAHRD
jgi:hypothetical protein